METVILAKLLFALYVLVILAGAFMAVLARNLVRAMVGLVLTMFGVAGLYLVLNAPFIALMQLLIYVGAVVILIFFAIMLTRAPVGGEEYESRGPRQAGLAFLAGIAPAAILAFICVKAPQVSIGMPKEVGIQELGRALMEDYVLAFELISAVLLVAMAGAVLLAWERRRGR
ncbi:NADH-quinone oxidoreductase subunit J [Desulfobaculum xiamenense]|uniref:NADH-quinone oxidoreductase subunit J n=1 Tax=Desulfobaculum xiamenense TaxID=995050 RepID=A0A846QQL3_9BACT|nr:NADH-quinone oxidoreductase subunit J [Desulfobaculum xiamenense]NJB67685.1 NADH-quinone oxidoreductase subunit J [Desulfobaculum xiamenense]